MSLPANYRGSVGASGLAETLNLITACYSDYVICYASTAISAVAARGSVVPGANVRLPPLLARGSSMTRECRELPRVRMGAAPPECEFGAF